MSKSTCIVTMQGRGVAFLRSGSHASKAARPTCVMSLVQYTLQVPVKV